MVLLLTISLFLDSQEGQASQTEIRYIMGTVFSVVLPQEVPAATINACFRLATNLERLATTYDRRSPIMQLRLEQGNFNQVPKVQQEELLQYLRRSLDFMQRSEGAFHPATGRKPFASMETLQTAMEDYSLGKNHPVAWDLGGMLKGTAIDQMIDFLKQAEIPWALVNGGGDLRWYGRSQSIIIRQPGNQEEDIPLWLVNLEAGALATSANDRRTAPDGDGTEGHIRRPGAEFSEEIRQVSVLAATAEEADAWATAIFVAGEKKARGWAPREGFSAALLLNDGTQTLIGGQKNVFAHP